MATGLAFVGACGDDDSTPDAAPGNPDAAATADAAATPDAMPPDAAPTATRSGTVSIQDVRFTDPETLAYGGIGGLAATIFFSDLTAHDPVAPVFAVGSVTAGCSVTKWTVTDGVSNEPPDIGEGTVSLSGSALATAQPLPCGWSDTSAAYLCPVGGIMTPVTATVTSAETVGEAFALYTFPDTIDFSAAPYNLKPVTDFDVPVHYFNFVGFDDDKNNGNHPVIGHFPGATNILTVLNSSGGVAETKVDGVAFGAVTAIPAPGHISSADPLTYKNALLGDADQSLDITINPGPVIGETTFTGVKVSGEGLTLDATSDLPHALPTEMARDVTFSCDGMGGDCGPAAELLTIMLVTGRATNVPVINADNTPTSNCGAAKDQTCSPWDLPKADGDYITFACTYIGAKSVTIPSAAIQAILDSKPTRIQTRVFQAGARLGASGPNGLTILAGHGLIGHTTFPVAAQ